jgi:hypothetical protein
LVEHVSDERDYGLILPPLGETLIPGRFCVSTRSKERDKGSGAFAFYVNEVVREAAAHAHAPATERANRLPS